MGLGLWGWGGIDFLFSAYLDIEKCQFKKKMNICSKWAYLKITKMGILLDFAIKIFEAEIYKTKLPLQKIHRKPSISSLNWQNLRRLTLWMLDLSSQLFCPWGCEEKVDLLRFVSLKESLNPNATIRGTNHPKGHLIQY